jgi:predicted lipoprotein with Yx(FWY)xxD motif
MTVNRRLFLLAMAPIAAITAACGSSSTSGPSTTKPPSATSSQTSPPTVMTANNPRFGRIVVDSQGRTLYTFTTGGRPAPCNAECLDVWPAALLPSGQTQATTGSGLTNVGTMATNGVKQLTHDGLPLYRFSGDGSAGAANGNGINSFGGLWQVVKVSGAGTGAANGTTGGSSSTSGSGY